MSESGAAEDYAAGDVDVIAGGNEITDDVKDRRHSLARKDVTRKEDAGEKSEKGKLNGFGLGIGFARNEDADGKRNEKIRKRKECENQHAAVDGNLKDEAHERENQAELRKTDREIGKQLAEEQSHGADGSDEKLFEGAALFFADNGEGRQERGDVEQQNGSEAREKEIRRARAGIEEQLGAHVDGKGSAVLENAAQRFIEANGGGYVDGLAGDGRVRAVNEDEDLSAHVMEQAVGIIYRNLDAHARPGGNDGVVQIAVIIDVTHDMKRVGVSQPIHQFAALAAAVEVQDHGIDLPDVGVNTETKHNHLQQRNDEGKEKRRGVTADMQDFLIKDSAETAEEVTHGRPPAALDVYR